MSKARTPERKQLKYEGKVLLEAPAKWEQERARILRNWSEEVEILCLMLKDQKRRSDRQKNTFLTELDRLQSSLEVQGLLQQHDRVVETKCKGLKIENERLASEVRSAKSAHNLLKRQLEEKEAQCKLHQQEANHLREALAHKEQKPAQSAPVNIQMLESELAAAKSRIRQLETDLLSKGFRLKEAESAVSAIGNMKLGQVESNISKMQSAIQATEDELKELRLQHVLTGQGKNEIKEVKQQLSQMKAMLQTEEKIVKNVSLRAT